MNAREREIVLRFLGGLSNGVNASDLAEDVERLLALLGIEVPSWDDLTELSQVVSGADDRGFWDPDIEVLDYVPPDA